MDGRRTRTPSKRRSSVDFTSIFHLQRLRRHADEHRNHRRSVSFGSLGRNYGVQDCVGAAVGLGTSGIWSVWEIERAEKRAEILQLERAMLTDLDDTKIERQKAGARKVNAVMSGIGPLIGIFLPLLPFLLHGVYLSLLEATVIAVSIGVGVLFVFGAYLGQLSEQNWYIAGVRMGLAGLVVALINLLLTG